MKFEKVKVASNNDIALFLKQFKGSCKVCGEIEHKAEDCLKLGKNKGLRIFQKTIQEQKQPQEEEYRMF